MRGTGLHCGMSVAVVAILVLACVTVHENAATEFEKDLLVEVDDASGYLIFGEGRAPLFLVPAQRATANEQREGDGARVRRCVGTQTVRAMDPLLLFDHYHVSPPHGFPPHPHRGQSLLSYQIRGSFKHRDSYGGHAEIFAHGAQKIVAGKGLIHSEMPGASEPAVGFQIWVNLPMTSKDVEPYYQVVDAADLVTTFASSAHHTLVRVVVGKFNEHTGRLSFEPEGNRHTSLLHVDVVPGDAFVWDIPAQCNALLYVYRGTLVDALGNTFSEHECIYFEAQTSGSEPQQTRRLSLDALEVPGHLNSSFVLFVSEPLREPVFHYGPFAASYRHEINAWIGAYQRGEYGVLAK
ncbi:Pirin-like protein 2 [Porphyridium purpureum]|uniref:Pirin-like protein 2 n=1 Tax=Porphyridium purpureum TaxID=35688 RepID=A0A5J4YTH5_PORPP|nr:Pirin-like protein 2 [Porphyridium purpureum]|eukprot:POR0698..scf229_5